MVLYISKYEYVYYAASRLISFTIYLKEPVVRINYKYHAEIAYCISRDTSLPYDFNCIYKTIHFKAIYKLDYLSTSQKPILSDSRSFTGIEMSTVNLEHIYWYSLNDENIISLLA